MLQSESSSSIQELPEFVINQIKAGEVIERPSQLFKEIIENSIDALSKNIEIKIRNNGLDLIQIKDDGIGILYQDLPLAFKRHATSKIQNFSDIYEIYSYGFRGEALASIAAVSKISCQSSHRSDLSPAIIKIDGGKIETHETIKGSSSQGTLIEIKDLFFNTPVRLKFLKSQTAEKRAIQNILESFLISWPQISFSIQWDDDEKSYYPATTNPKDRVKSVMFKKKLYQDGMLFLNEEFETLQVLGYFSPIASKGGYKKQHLFVNGRLFHDKALHFFLMKQMEKVWGSGQTGHYVLQISIPSDQIDVNIHPSKTHIKFEDESSLYSLISKGIRQLPQIENSAMRPSETNSGPFQNQHHTTENTLPYNGNPRTESHSSYSSERKREILQGSTHYQEQSILSISNRFFIQVAVDDNDPVLIDKASFLIFFLKEYLNDQSRPSVPLIISDPFQRGKLNSEDLENFLAQTNIELEILDENIILLRSIPHALTKLPYQQIIEAFLENFKTRNEISLESCQWAPTMSNFHSHQIIGILADYQLDLEGQSFTMPITSKLLQHDS